MRSIVQEKKLTQYVLGELSPEERLELENRYIADADFFDHLLAAEDDLIDDYAQGRLSNRESILFENNFLISPERRERVRAAKVLARFIEANQVVSEKVSLRKRILSYLEINSTLTRLAFATAMLLLVVGLAVIWIELSQVRSQLAKLQSGYEAQLQREEDLKQKLGEQDQATKQLDEQLRNEQSGLQQEIAQLRESQVEVSSYALGPGILGTPRGGDPEENRQKIAVPARTEIVRLRLDLTKDEYPSYLVMLESEAGQVVWRTPVSASKSAKGASIVVRIPSRLLKSGKYHLVLNGSSDAKTIETISEYPLLVVKK